MNLYEFEIGLGIKARVRANSEEEALDKYRKENFHDRHFETNFPLDIIDESGLPLFLKQKKDIVYIQPK